MRRRIFTMAVVGTVASLTLLICYRHRGIAYSWLDKYQVVLQGSALGFRVYEPTAWLRPSEGLVWYRWSGNRVQMGWWGVSQGIAQVHLPLWVPVVVLAVTAAFTAPWSSRRSYRRRNHLCLECGYAQAGLTELRCPECGADSPRSGAAALLNRFGLQPVASDVPLLRAMLKREIDCESAPQTAGDLEAMRLLCAQLFCAGSLDDILLIWEAQRSSKEAGAAIQVQFLCPTGLDASRRFLHTVGTPEAMDIVRYLDAAAADGDLEGFSPAEYRQALTHDYELPSQEISLDVREQHRAGRGEPTRSA